MSKEAEAPIYGDYKNAKLAGADYDVECAGDGDNESAREGESKKKE